MVKNILNNKVDAVSTWNPHLTKIQKQLKYKSLIYYSNGLYTPTFNILGSKDFVNKNPELIIKFLKALNRAVIYISKNKENSIKITSKNTDNLPFF